MARQLRDIDLPFRIVGYMAITIATAIAVSVASAFVGLAVLIWRLVLG